MKQGNTRVRSFADSLGAILGKSTIVCHQLSGPLSRKGLRSGMPQLLRHDTGSAAVSGVMLKQSFTSFF